MKQFLNLHVLERQSNRNIPHQDANAIVSFRQVFFFLQQRQRHPGGVTCPQSTLPNLNSGNELKGAASEG
jgi:hypothetical protein